MDVQIPPVFYTTWSPPGPLPCLQNSYHCTIPQQGKGTISCLLATGSSLSHIFQDPSAGLRRERVFPFSYFLFLLFQDPSAGLRKERVFPFSSLSRIFCFFFFRILLLAGVEDAYFLSHGPTLDLGFLCKATLNALRETFAHFQVRLRVCAERNLCLFLILGTAKR